MDLYPSIDLRAGQVVRLYQGDYARETVYGVDAVTAATAFADAGARWIHAALLDPNAAGTLSPEAIVELVDAMIDAHGDAMPEGIR